MSRSLCHQPLRAPPDLRISCLGAICILRFSLFTQLDGSDYVLKLLAVLKVGDEKQPLLLCGCSVLYCKLFYVCAYYVPSPMDDVLHMPEAGRWRGWKLSDTESLVPDFHLLLLKSGQCAHRTSRKLGF